MADNRGSSLGHGLRHRTPRGLAYFTRLQTPEKPCTFLAKPRSLMKDTWSEDRWQGLGRV